MKNRFTTLDLIAILSEIKTSLVGTRVLQVYDVDNKTFLIRFMRPGSEDVKEETLKQVLLLESGIRLHLTEYDWPKNSTPSGFTMKLRKHLRNKRLESINQIGNDRIVDLQFGTSEFTNHLILELYSKGNIILTDKDYVILSLIRIYKDTKTNVNISVREKYPLNQDIYVAEKSKLTPSKILEILKEAKNGDFKKVFNPYFLYGPDLLEHSLLQFKEVNSKKFKVSVDDIELLNQIFNYADKQIENLKTDSSKGYIIFKTDKRIDSEEEIKVYQEYHPFLFKQFQSSKNQIEEHESFNKAVDIFFSSMEAQRIGSKISQQEKQAFKKLEAIKKDHETRLENLTKLQEIDNKKAALIENNIELVDKAISVLRSSIASKYSWDMISEMVRDAQDAGDLIASRIKSLKLEKNCFSMLLSDPYETDQNSMVVDIDIGLSAFANAQKFYEHRKDAAKKEKKTIDHTQKVFKNVERKVKQQLKETTIKTNIVMAKKTLWFEKFFWFISSEGYLVIAGRDAQQNELIVKRYLNKDDIYVHADIHGATSVIVKNHTEKSEIPPKTINEAANMAVCYSASWEAKVVSAAYWVYSNQVQKTAPTGQYLSVGSFMIRGKKNYVSLQNLVLGFGILFRIDDESVERRKALKNKTLNDDDQKNMELFPDTTIKYKALLDERKIDENHEDENAYTIINTGESLKKKVKVFTQKNLNKKKINPKENKKKPSLESKSLPNEPENIDSTEKSTNENEILNEEKYSEQNDTDNNEIEEEKNDDKENEIKESSDDEEFSDEEEGDEKDFVKKLSDAQRLIDSLVWNPTTEDHLNYAITMCGPYSALQSFKYKVKIIPGTSKRGKASKNALMIFLKEKSSTERERDLLKAIKDQDISRNMPAKVKIVNTSAK